MNNDYLMKEIIKRDIKFDKAFHNLKRKINEWSFPNEKGEMYMSVLTLQSIIKEVMK